MSSQEGRGCFKTGLWGCLGLIGLGFVGMLALSGLAFFSARIEADPTTDSTSYDLPGEVASAPVSPGESEGAENVATAEQLADVRGRELPTETVVGTGVGTLDLDLAVGEFVLVPVAADQPLEVIADYDKARYRLTEEFEEGANGDWTYRVAFRGRRTFLFGEGDDNRVEIRVPRGHPVSITGEVKMGKVEFDLGGLALRDVVLETGMGDIQIDVSEPTSTPAEVFRVTGRMGELGLERIGNASPKNVEVRFRMGQATLELDGAWRNDASVTMRCNMGECSARVPDDVFVDVSADAVMGGRNVRLPDQSEVPEGAPTLQLHVVASMGEARVRWRPAGTAGRVTASISRRAPSSAPRACARSSWRSS